MASEEQPRIDEPDAAPLGHAATLADTGLENEAPPSRPSRGPAVGDRFGQYHVVAQLGAGAMGTVVEAYDETLDRRVAIKLLHERRSGRQERRLLREAQALARLSHPHVVQVYEVGEAAGHTFIAMELVDGQTLEQWQKEPRTWREVVGAYIQAGQGLAAAHAEGLVHRDFKPSNCILDARGRVKVLDFGLARESVVSDEKEATLSSTDRAALLDLTSDSQSNSALSEVLTRTGALLGTPAYMAPEQLKGSRVGAASDQFNFCVALYEGLYGHRPFPHDSIGELITAVLGGKLRPPPPRSRVPRALWHVLRRGLADHPSERWPSMDALLERLERLTTRRTRGRWLFVAGFSVAATGGVLWGQSETTPPCQGATERLAEVWDEDRAQAVGQALLSTGVSYADSTRERVRDTLDAYAKDWVARHTATCEATSVHQQQSARVLDLRMSCLEERRTALLRTVELLEHADAGMVENAVGMASSLPSLDRCDDAAALEAALAPPEDPEVAAEVDALRDQLAKARTLARAHRDQEVLAVVGPVLERAETLAYPPLLVEARLARGVAHKVQGHYSEARDDLTAAFDLGLEIGHDELAARASLELTVVVGHEMAEREVGRTWGVAAEALARRIEPEGPLHALALRGTAIVQIYQGQIDGAESRFQHAMQIWDAQSDPSGPDLARALGDMGNLAVQQGRFDESLDSYRRAQSVRKQWLGEGHPSLGTDEINLGRAYEMKGDLDQAGQHYRSALTLWQSTRDSKHPDLAIAYNNLAVVLDKQGNPDEALDLHQHALAIREATLGADHPYVAHSAANIGLALRAKGEHERSLPYFQRAFDIFEPRGGLDVEHALYELSEAELLLGKLEDARSKRERLVELARTHGKEDPHQFAFAELALARVQWAQGETAKAIRLVERARARAIEAGPAGAAMQRDASSWLAEHSEP